MISHIFIDQGVPATRGLRITRAMIALFFCLVWLAIAGYEAHRAWHEGEWRQATCTIVRSSVVANVADVHDEHEAYTLRTRFRYPVNGQEFTASEESKFELVAEADALAESRASGALVPCWINLNNPNLAKLDPQRPWATYVFFVGTIIVNALLVYFYVIPQCRAAPPRRSASPDRKAKVERWAAALVFLGMSAWLVWGFILPLIESARAATWPLVQCVIDSSTLAKQEVHGEVSLTLYRPDVLYRYAINGRSYRSNCYSFTDFATPLMVYKRRDAQAFPEGKEATCRVDPSNPRRAVLKISPGPSMLIALFPLTMIGLCIVALMQGFTKASMRMVSRRFSGARVDVPQPFRNQAIVSARRTFMLYVLSAMVMCMITAGFITDLITANGGVTGDQWIIAGFLAFISVGLVAATIRKLPAREP